MEGKETKITITINERGNVSVNGPLDNKLLCYGLLEIARDAVKDYKPKVVEAPMNFLNGLIKK